MNHYDDLLREQEKEELFDDNLMEKHWADLEKKLDIPVEQLTVKPKSKIRKWLKHFVAAAAVSIVAFFGYKMIKSAKEQKQTLTTATKTVLQPPQKSIDIPYENFTMDASIGDTLFTKNGSILIFPKNAVLDKSGVVVKGIIQVQTREFNDAFDYCIAGIPMNYDSAGIQYKFISSGMVDIKAYQNNELLYVNPKAKPQLHLVSTSTENNTNLYALDTISGNWINKGKDTITDVAKLDFYKANNYGPEPILSINTPSNNPVINKTVQKPITTTNAKPKQEETTIPKPVAPEKASGKNPVIEILIDPASFKELMVYNNLKFEVLSNNSEEVSKASKTEWEDIELKKGAVKGTYQAKFSTAKETVLYDVKPVFEDKDFDKALEQYKEKLEAYNRLLQEQNIYYADTIKRRYDYSIPDSSTRNTITIEVPTEVNNYSVPQYNQEIKRIEALNKLIAIRNATIAEQNSITEAENKKILALIKENTRRIAEQTRISDSIQKVWETQSRAAQLHTNLYRSFEIDGFGYWNCDQVSNPDVKEYVVNFTDEQNQKLSFTQISFAIIGINSLLTFYDTKININSNKKHIAWFFSNDTFYYLTTSDFTKIDWENNASATMIMRKYTGNPNSYTDLKRKVFGELISSK
jgi:hypothetical protein